MRTSMRNFIKILGGGVVLAAAGSGVWASTRQPSAARRPWATAGEGGKNPDVRRRALSFGVLAPNPHNKQPWLVDLSTPDELTLYCQADRRLPETDPCDRQITIGLGAFLEILSMAAAKNDYRADVTVFPRGEPHPRLDNRPVALMRFVQDGSVRRDPLFAQVLRRRTNRSIYDGNRLVAASILERIGEAATVARFGWTDDPVKKKVLASLAIDALRTEMTTRRTALETVDALRVGKAAIDRRPDGIALAGPFVEAMHDVGLLDIHDLLDPKSGISRQESQAEREQIESSSAFAWLVTAGNSRAAQIAAGRDYLRFCLAATDAGLAMQPLSQSLQEYPEMGGYYKKMRNALDVRPNETLQMFVRLGYAPKVEPAPRWPFQMRIMAA